MSEPSAFVCSICAALIHNDADSKVLHGAWHDLFASVVKRILEPE